MHGPEVTGADMAIAMIVAGVIVGLWAGIVWIGSLPVRVNGYPMKVWEAVALTPVFVVTFIALGVLIVCTETVKLVHGRHHGK